MVEKRRKGGEKRKGRKKKGWRRKGVEGRRRVRQGRGWEATRGEGEE
jgi:hypothetical protein